MLIDKYVFIRSALMCTTQDEKYLYINHLQLYKEHSIGKKDTSLHQFYFWLVNFLFILEAFIVCHLIS